jgi:hypothetical protein
MASEVEGLRVPIVVLSRSDSPPTAISRVGGPGYALGNRQPTRDGELLTHVFTLAIADVPPLREGFPEAVAVALYVFHPELNEASTPYNHDAVLVGLGTADVESGAGPGTPDDLDERGVKASQLLIPDAIFDGQDEEEDEEEEEENEVENDNEDNDARAKLEAIRQAVYALPARAGGAPQWLQRREAGHPFLMQFDHTFVRINLGDCGIMYVFGDTAYWQCY